MKEPECPCDPAHRLREEMEGRDPELCRVHQADEIRQRKHEAEAAERDEAYTRLWQAHANVQANTSPSMALNSPDIAAAAAGPAATVSSPRQLLERDIIAALSEPLNTE